MFLSAILILENELPNMAAEKGYKFMGITDTSGNYQCNLPWGYNAYMVTEGSFDGVSREEKLAMRQAERAARRFRAERGYEQPPAILRLLHNIFRVR